MSRWKFGLAVISTLCFLVGIFYFWATETVHDGLINRQPASKNKRPGEFDSTGCAQIMPNETFQKLIEEGIKTEEGPKLRLLLEDVEFPTDAMVSARVFVNKPDVDIHTPIDDPHYLGIFSPGHYAEPANYVFHLKSRVFHGWKSGDPIVVKLVAVSDRQEPIEKVWVKAKTFVISQSGTWE